jgi:flagellar L-ring protein precursor FlgH
MKKLLVILAAAVLIAPAQAQTDPKAASGSLYSGGISNPLTDRTARRLGDLVTILVDEQTVATFAASTAADKADSSSINLKTFIGFVDDLFKPLVNGNSASSTVSGSGSTSQNSRLTARLTAKVTEVDPSGNLRIEGRRTLVTNKETQTLVLRGLIRPMDVTPANTITSALIGEAEIRVEGVGMIQERQRKGVLTQILDWIF